MFVFLGGGGLNIFMPIGGCGYLPFVLGQPPKRTVQFTHANTTPNKHNS